MEALGASTYRRRDILSDWLTNLMNKDELQSIDISKFLSGSADVEEGEVKVNDEQEIKALEKQRDADEQNTIRKFIKNVNRSHWM